MSLDSYPVSLEMIGTPLENVVNRYVSLTRRSGSEDSKREQGLLVSSVDHAAKPMLFRGLPRDGNGDN